MSLSISRTPEVIEALSGHRHLNFCPLLGVEEAKLPPEAAPSHLGALDRRLCSCRLALGLLGAGRKMKVGGGSGRELGPNRYMLLKV